MLTKENSGDIVGGGSAPSPSSLAKSEGNKYSRIWEHDQYRKHSPAERLFDEIYDHVLSVSARSIVDCGCGTGRLSAKIANRGIDVAMLDIAYNCLDEYVRERLDEGLRFNRVCLWHDEVRQHKADMVVCCDVMEHIPPSRVDAVIANIKTMAPHGYLQIACYKDGYGSLIGESLHLTVEPPEFWVEKFPGAMWATRGGDVKIWY